MRVRNRPRSGWPLTLLVIGLACLAAGCSAREPSAAKEFKTPDWHLYRAHDAPPRGSGPMIAAVQKAYSPRGPDRFTLADLRGESDASLAARLLGQVGKRIAFIDRYPEGRPEHAGDDEPASKIDLYTHPVELGAYGLCGIERYRIAFDRNGRIEEVSQSRRYGVEGPIFQKSGFDFHLNGRRCAAAPASHGPSYFPAPNESIADDTALLLLLAVDLSRSNAADPGFRLSCRRYEGSACLSRPRRFLAGLRLGDVDEVTLANCPLDASDPRKVCFTLEVGRDQVGPNPKYITVRGSTFMNDWKVESVEIQEGSTMA